MSCVNHEEQSCKWSSLQVASVLLQRDLPIFRAILCSLIIAIQSSVFLVDTVDREEKKTGMWSCCGSFMWPWLSKVAQAFTLLFLPPLPFPSCQTPVWNFLMQAQLDMLIKVEILNASHSEDTEWSMRLIRSHSGVFFQPVGNLGTFFLFFFFWEGGYLGPLDKNNANAVWLWAPQWFTGSWLLPGQVLFQVPAS